MKPIILTLSRFPDIRRRLTASILLHELQSYRFMVSDGPDLPYGEPWEFTVGPRPFIFARNVNIGFLWIGPDRDILLINDDCQLTMPVLDTLQRICDENQQIGLLAPQIDGGVGNPLQRFVPNICANPPAWYPSRERLAFVCVYIPAKTREIVGPLNESFTGYGGEDDEYCRRVQAAGLELAVTPLVSVVHGYGPNGMSTSFDRVMGREARDRSMAEMLTLERNLRARMIPLPPRVETRKLIVPEVALAERMILSARRAFAHLAADKNEFVASLSAAQSHWAWTFDLEAGIPFWNCCQAMGRDPEDERETMLSRLDDDLRKIVVGRRGFRCPCCSKIKEK